MIQRLLNSTYSKPRWTRFDRGLACEGAGADCSDMVPAPAEVGLSGLFLGAEQLAVDQHFRDLDRVQRRTLAQIVRHAPQRESVLDRRVFTDAADIGRILAGRLVGRDVAAGLVL